MFIIIITGLLIASAAAWAIDDLGNVGGAIRDVELPPTPVDFDVTVLNTFECSYASSIMGLDYVEFSPNRLIFACNQDDKIYACNPDDGTYIDDVDCDGANDYAFGIAMKPSSPSKSYVNDFVNTNIYVNSGGPWSTNSNPAGDDGRGMDYAAGSTDYVWESYSNGPNPPRGCYRMSTDLGSNDYIDFPEVPSQMSGLTWFDYGGGEGILCTTYETHNLYFYTISGTTATLEGTIIDPVSSDSYYMGLTYSPTRDTVFLSYINAGTEYVSELDIDPAASIKSASLGEIKALFK